MQLASTDFSPQHPLNATWMYLKMQVVPATATETTVNTISSLLTPIAATISQKDLGRWSRFDIVALARRASYISTGLYTTLFLIAGKAVQCVVLSLSMVAVSRCNQKR